MKQILCDFLIYLEYEKNLSVNSIMAYQTDIQELLNHIPSITHLSKETLQDYFLALQKKKHQANTCARKWSAIKTFLIYLYQENQLKKNPKDWVVCRNTTLKLPHALSESEINQLLLQPCQSRYPLRDSAIIDLLYTSGLRISECVQLNKNQFIKPKQWIHIIGKGNKERKVPINPHTQTRIEHYLKNEFPLYHKSLTPALFLNKNGTRLSRQSIYLMIKAQAKICHLPPDTSPHTLRHSCATHLLNHSMPLLELQQLLGHANIKTTEKYTHTSKKALKEIHQKCHPRK